MSPEGDRPAVSMSYGRRRGLSTVCGATANVRLFRITLSERKPITSRPVGCYMYLA